MPMEKRRSILDMFDEIKQSQKKKNSDISKENEESVINSSFVNDDITNSFIRDNESINNTFIEGNSSITSFTASDDFVNKKNLEKISENLPKHFKNNSNKNYIDNYTTPQSSIEQPGRYSFLLNIKDKNLNSPDHPNYDPTSLYIPEKYYKEFTPFERQFWDIKKNHFDTVIFFKKGKFYELYEGDAEIASRYFDMKVTERVNMKMSGFPESSYDVWAGKFLQNGFKIARVEQKENQLAKKMREKGTKGNKDIIERELKEIITQGTVYNNEHLTSPLPIYIAVIQAYNSHESLDCNYPFHFSILLYDASINQMYFRSFCDGNDLNFLKSIFIQNDIKEVISEEKIEIKGKENIKQVFVENMTMNGADCRIAFSSISNKNIQSREFDCFSQLYKYFTSLNRQSILENSNIQTLSDNIKMMHLDGSTIENMDLLENNYDNSSKNTLFSKINYCFTPFGTRLLKRWLLTPLIKKELIVERQLRSKIISKEIHILSPLIKNIGDLERFYAKLNNNSATLKDLTKFLQSLNYCKDFFEKWNEIFTNSTNNINSFFKNDLFDQIRILIEKFNKNYQIIDQTIQPVNTSDELYKLTEEFRNVENQLLNYLERIQLIVKAPLKYKSINKDIYQIEVDSKVDMPSEFYVNSCTKTTKRYYSKELVKIVDNLKEKEERIFQSQSGLFGRATGFFKEYSILFSKIITYLATADCYMAISIFNRNSEFSTPIFTENEISIKNMTNPIYSKYIKNDFEPNTNICLITGPNMGGKSTFLRSICLNVILAQIGFNVAAEIFKVPIFDQIFTRIGASDSLAKGESTFMMEMNEASKILNQSTNKTFVIMDELGRGTSTKDGEAIARAVLDHLRKIGSFTLFSTHYHGLVSNYGVCSDESITVDKYFVRCMVENENITFLYKIARGVCLDSHGLYVAKLAEIPEEILQRAKIIRSDLMKSLNK